MDSEKYRKERQDVLRQFKAVSNDHHHQMKNHLNRLKQAVANVDADMDTKMSGFQSLIDTREEVTKQIKNSLQASDEYSQSTGSSLGDAVSSVQKWISLRNQSSQEENRALSARERYLEASASEGQLGSELVDKIAGALRLDDASSKILIGKVMEISEVMLEKEREQFGDVAGRIKGVQHDAKLARDAQKQAEARYNSLRAQYNHSQQQLRITEKKLSSQMNYYSSELMYEDSARMRDQLKAINSFKI